MNENYQNIDLASAISVMAGKFPAISEIYIFGSRRFNTESFRSDIDLLVTMSQRIKASDLRDFTIEFSSALDIFILESGRATSIANESYITDESNELLIKKLNAVKLFDRHAGKLDALTEYRTLKLDKRVKHELTVFPNTTADGWEVKALIKYFDTAQKHGLPVKPYIGLNADEASDFIIKVLRNLASTNTTLGGRGQAKGSWTQNIKDEYDFQNLFWITVRPWLPGIGKEEVELKYDGNEKRSDFNLFNNQVVIELKHVKDENEKRNIIKTLNGLSSFYSQHPNIRVLIFGILVNKNVELNDEKWEADFSFDENHTKVKTVIVRNW
jgi:predicted nucleotidyltransferase